MFSRKPSGTTANSKEKAFSVSPLANTSVYTANNQDSVINNYNVKVNITKKNKKNISIGNLTLNNLNFLKGKELHNLHLANNKLDCFMMQKSENLSPKSIDKDKHIPSYPPEGKNANTVLNSPKQSYNKIISKLKSEFEKIASRTHSKNNTKEEGNNANEDDTLKEKLNKNRANCKKGAEEVAKPVKAGMRMHPVMINNVNDMTTTNITSHKFLLKPHLTTNYSKKEKKRKGNDIISSNLNEYSHIDKLNATNDMNTSSILNTKDITTQDKSSIFMSKEVSFSLGNKYSSSELHTALMAMSNDLSQEKEAHSQTIQEMKDCQLTIRLLTEYIKSQQAVYIQEAQRRQVLDKHKSDNHFFDKYNEAISSLVKHSNDLKGVIHKMLFFIEKDYIDNNRAFNRYESAINRLAKENAFLRSLTFNMKSAFLISAPSTAEKDMPSLEKGKVHKRQDTQIIYNSDTDSQIIKESFDHLSHSMKEIKSLKRTMQKEQPNGPNTRNSPAYYWNDMRKKGNQLKRNLCYLKKR